MLYWLLDGFMAITSALYSRPLVGGSIIIAPVYLLSPQWCAILLVSNVAMVMLNRFGDYLYRGADPIKVVDVQPQEKEINYDLDGEAMWDAIFAGEPVEGVDQSQMGMV